jgi:pimeloyl-ACP methyl ester carboxylesterase
MKIAASLPLQHTGADYAYEFRRDPHFSPEVKHASRLFTAVVPCLTGIGCLYQAVAAARDRRIYPPPGSLVDIDGCRMHLQTKGAGAATVVLEAGLGGMSSAWAWIQPEAAKFSRVVSYDRAGLGWSETDLAPKTAQLAARRLRTLLRRSHALPPYILVGHSMGGLLIRVFAEQYLDEVAGIVLVDASHPDQHLRSPDIKTHMRSGFRLLRAVPLLAQLGYVRLTGLFNAWAEGLPPRQAAEAEAFLSSYRHLQTTREESVAWEAVCAEVRCTSGLEDIPLAVVTAGRDVLPGHPELQGELAALSRDSIHVTVKGADHLTLLTRREHARSVTEVIRNVVGRGMLRWRGIKLRRAPRNRP